MLKKLFIFVIIQFSMDNFGAHSVPSPEEDLEYEIDDGNDQKWDGKWFPKPPDQKEDSNPIVFSLEELKDKKHGIKMGVASANCDDAKARLEVDWLDDPRNYTCYESKCNYLPNGDVRPIFSNDFIPKEYSAPHKCMDEAITYDDYIPTFGPHRPLWPKYGEYVFVPRQRWIHSLEHGATVMLYHPCANVYEVDYLRSLVVNCLYRHVITPYNFLTQERPLALVAWGKRLEMSKVDPKIVMEFIQIAAKRGPEHTAKDGQYDYGLVRHANIVTDEKDDVLCPNMSNIETE